MHRSKTRSVSSLRGTRQMPVIVEREDDTGPVEADVASVAPTLPEKSPRRAELAGLRDSLPLAFHLHAPPPAYRVDTPPSTAATSEAASPPKKIAVRKPGWVARRGGWWRLGLIVLAILSCILALALGLALGLKSKSSGNSSSSSSTGDNSSTTALRFPAGSYAFTTALANISTSCTNNTNTFRCYPYTTYSASGSAASAIFYWSIAQAATSISSSAQDEEYVISAASNPFVPQFQNISMTVLDRDTANERLEFSFPLDLALVPAAALDAADTAATCYFNDTIMGATIWTRRAAEFPANVTTTNAGGGGINSNTTIPSTDFEAWPFAVQVRQSAAAGAGVPTCVGSSDGRSLGDFESVGGGSCSCLYSNFGLSS